MSFYDNRYYYLNKMLLSNVGLWPFQSRLEGNVMLAIALLFTCSLTALELWGLITGITDLSIFMENTSPLLVNSFILIKLINYMFNKYKIRKLLEYIEETWKIIQVDQEKEILQNYAEKSKTYTIQYAASTLYSTMPLISAGMYLLFPTNETHTPKFLYRLEHVVNMDKYFNVLILHAIVAIYFFAVIMISTDCMFVLCIQHVCALFAGIRYNMERIGNSDFVILKPNMAEDEAYRIIVHCIVSYKHALKYVDLLSSTFATSFFFILGNVVIGLSFSATELIMVKSQFIEVIRIIIFNAGQFIHIFDLSLMCQQLIDHSSELQNVIYSCNWYKISLRSRQLLRFMLLRATRPCEIKAGKLYVMSMENFSSILRLSASYFTMLTSIQ